MGRGLALLLAGSLVIVGTQGGAAAQRRAQQAPPPAQGVPPEAEPPAGGTPPAEVTPPEAAEPPAAAPAPDAPPQVTDDVIVGVLIATEGIVQQTAAVGLSRPRGEVRDQARRVHASLGQMIKRLRTYAERHGYPTAPAGGADDATVGDVRLAQFLDELRALEGEQFGPAFLAVLHDFLDQTRDIVHGAGQLANDPALRTMLVEMQTEIDGHLQRIAMMRDRHPPPPRLDQR